jgi:hypothetical protein
MPTISLGSSKPRIRIAAALPYAMVRSWPTMTTPSAMLWRMAAAVARARARREAQRRITRYTIPAPRSTKSQPFAVSRRPISTGSCTRRYSTRSVMSTHTSPERTNTMAPRAARPRRRP